MGDQVKLLTPDEIAAMRADLGKPMPHFSESTGERWSDARIVATLEALAALAHQRLDDLIDAQAERDTWRAEAEDQRARVSRLEAELEAGQERLDQMEQMHQAQTERLRDDHEMLVDAVATGQALQPISVLIEAPSGWEPPCQPRE